jgi:hypothetical protein
VTNSPKCCSFDTSCLATKKAFSGSPGQFRVFMDSTAFVIETARIKIAVEKNGESVGDA